jgi:hypothetical protein
MAEKVRFELTVLAYTRVPGVHLKPLGHLSVTKYSVMGFSYSFQSMKKV